MCVPDATHLVLKVISDKTNADAARHSVPGTSTCGASAKLAAVRFCAAEFVDA